MFRRIAFRFQIGKFILNLIDSFDSVLLSLFWFFILLHIGTNYIIRLLFSIDFTCFNQIWFNFKLVIQFWFGSTNFVLSNLIYIDFFNLPNIITEYIIPLVFLSILISSTLCKSNLNESIHSDLIRLMQFRLTQFISTFYPPTYMYRPYHRIALLYPCPSFQRIVI